MQELNSVLLACALEADRNALKNGTGIDAKQGGIAFKSELQKMVEETTRFYVDRKLLRTPRFNNSRGSKFKGYGLSRSPSPRRELTPRIPPDVCTVC